MSADEEVFARLQRHNELLECTQAITGHNFHFGIGIRGSSMSSLGVKIFYRGVSKPLTHSELAKLY
jgi:hypothetical protein